MIERLAISWGLAFGLAAVALLVREQERRATGTEPPVLTDYGGAALVALAVLGAAPPPRAANLAATCGSLTIGAACDARTGYLFDASTLTALAVALACATTSDTLGFSLAGALALGTPFASIALLSRGNALGFGDVKALFAIGASFGAVEGALVVSAASVAGILEASVRRRRSVRFGPHLAAGCVAVAVGRPEIIRLFGGT